MKILGEIIYNGERMSWEKGAISDNLVFLSGVEGINQSTGTCPPEIGVQTKVTLEKIKRRLEEAGTDVAHIVKYVAYVVGRENLEEYRSARASWLKENFLYLHHASTLILVAGLARPEMLVEIDVIAELPK